MKICYNLDDVDLIAAKLLENLKTKTILFYGPMGVGKTTLIKAFVKKLGSKDEVNSPTFSIVNEYKLKDNKIYHFDFYRIKNLEEALDFGIEDYIDSDNWKLIEWPEVIEPILSDQIDKVIIAMDLNIRKLEIINIY